MLVNENKSQMAELVESVVHSHNPTLLRDGRVSRILKKDIYFKKYSKKKVFIFEKQNFGILKKIFNFEKVNKFKTQKKVQPEGKTSVKEKYLQKKSI